MKISYLLSLLLLSIGLRAQIIPDLTKGDHFLPNLSEANKQELILQSAVKTQGNVAQTSQELYPELYRYTNTDYMGIHRGTSTDPSNAIANYVKTDYTKTASPPGANTPSVSAALYNNELSISERNRREIESDLKNYQNQQSRQEKLIDGAYKDFGPGVKYHLGVHNGNKVDRYINSYDHLRAMLEGSEKMDFSKAVWFVESAVDPTLSWDEFNGMLQRGTRLITALMQQNKLSLNDNLAKIMSIYRFMSDTTRVTLEAKEKNVTTKPLLYDYEDYEAREDITKIFVSKLLRTGSGQCMSLPMLYYLYAKALGAEVNLAFAPDHSYITFKDDRGTWQNIELTAGMLTTSDFYWQSGFIKAEQVKSGIYLKPLSEKETVSYLITTLTLAYVRTFGTDERVLDMALTAKDHFPNSLTANMILAGYSLELWKHVQRQYSTFRKSQADLDNDYQAQAIKQNSEKALNHVYQDLGWAKMPEWAYKKWLDGVNQLANKRQHLARKRQIEQQLNR